MKKYSIIALFVALVVSCRLVTMTLCSGTR